MNCEKVTYLIEKSQLKDLNLSERLQVKLHKYMCKYCMNYVNDTKVLQKLLHSLNQEQPNEKLTQEEKDEIKLAIKSL